MSGYAEAPIGFSCPHQHRCPHLELQSTTFFFNEYHRSRERERHWDESRQALVNENNALHTTLRERDKEIERLNAQLARAQKARFKPDHPVATRRKVRLPTASPASENPPPPRGAPVGHPHWHRPIPEHIDQVVEVAAPCTCPHCQSPTDKGRSESHSYIQEDIVLCPQTVVTEFRHATAWCPECQQQVLQTLPGEILNAPVGPNTKAAALWLRHEIKLPYRKITTILGSLFGMELVPASILGFEKKARAQAEPLYEDLIQNLRASPQIHADETYWREDGKNQYIFFAGNQQFSVFHVDPSRSNEAAKVLLGDKLDALLIADAYAGYNGIAVIARQSCLSHLIRKAKEILAELDALKTPDPAARRCCRWIKRILQAACRIPIPANDRDRKALVARFQNSLGKACEEPLRHPAAETFRKRLMPGSREHADAFAFILYGGPPTNNHAERALRPLVIFRKVCQGSRSRTGSENIAIFSSLTQTAKLQGRSVLELLQQLLCGTPDSSAEALYADSS